MAIKLKSPDIPESKLNAYIACSIVGLCGMAIVHALPTTSIINVRVDRVTEGSAASGAVHLVKVSQGDSQIERFETSQTQAKLLKECEVSTDSPKSCYVNLVVANGWIPFISDRQIIGSQIFKSGDANYPRRPDY
jgi:hypothetical protein